jgi:hypothetical protein
MPPLDNIKWERFCQNIVNGVAKHGQKNTQGQRYIEAGFHAQGCRQRRWLSRSLCIALAKAG